MSKTVIVTDSLRSEFFTECALTLRPIYPIRLTRTEFKEYINNYAVAVCSTNKSTIEEIKTLKPDAEVLFHTEVSLNVNTLLIVTNVTFIRVPYVLYTVLR